MYKRIYSSTDPTKYHLMADGEIILDAKGEKRNFTPAEAKAYEAELAKAPERAKDVKDGK